MALPRHATTVHEAHAATLLVDKGCCCHLEKTSSLAAQLSGMLGPRLASISFLGRGVLESCRQVERPACSRSDVTTEFAVLLDPCACGVARRPYGSAHVIEGSWLRRGDGNRVQAIRRRLEQFLCVDHERSRHTSVSRRLLDEIIFNALRTVAMRARVVVFFRLCCAVVELVARGGCGAAIAVCSSCASSSHAHRTHRRFLRSSLPTMSCRRRSLRNAWRTT